MCTRSFVGWSFAPDPLGELQRFQGPLAAFDGPASKGRGRGGESKVLENVHVRALLVHPAHYNDYALYKPRTYSLTLAF